MPVTVIAGPDQIRAPRPPVPMSGSPGSDLGELAELVVAVGRARPLLAPQPGDGDVAVLVVQRRERVQQGDQRVGRGAAELAAVLRRRRACRTSTVTIAMPRSATVSVGTPGRTLPMSPITIASRGEQLRVASAG